MMALIVVLTAVGRKQRLQLFTLGADRFPPGCFRHLVLVSRPGASAIKCC
jgi:hypothetical protein